MTQKADKNNIEEITRRLDVIIYLLLKKEEDTTVKQMIAQLSEIGFKNYEIAKILGKTESHVAKELSLLKKSSKEYNK